MKFTKIEIRKTENGYVVIGFRGRTFVFSDGVPKDAEAIMESFRLADAISFVKSNFQVVEHEPVEWTAKNADETMSIVRRLVEEDAER